MFTGFTKSIKDLKFGHPGIAAATAFAAVTAPLFLKDENRGYFRTALATAPVIGAMGLAGPGLVNSASRTAKGGLQFVRENPFFFSRDLTTNYKKLKEFVDSGTVDLGAINPALRTWVDDAAIDFFSTVDRGAPPIKESMDAAEKLFESLLKDSGKRSLLTYAVEGARLRAASPVQLAGSQQIGPMADMAESTLRETVNANRANPKFVEEFSRRLRWAQRLQDTGLATSLPEPAAGVSIQGLKFSEAYEMLRTQRPGVASALHAAIQKGTVAEATVMAEQTISGEIGQLLGINLKGKQGQLHIPLFDPNTGTVRTGEYYQRRDVGRRLYSSRSWEDLDVFVAQHLEHDWGTLGEDISRAVVRGGVDSLNEFKMETHLESQASTLPAHAMWIRSQAAVPTGLDLFAGGKSFRDLTASERIKQFQSLRDWGFTRIGSEGGTAKGVVEFAGSELYTFGGMPSLEKQTAFYRSFSKELQLAPDTILPDWVSHVTTGAAEGLGGVPEVRMQVAGISPQVRSLFGDLPENVLDLPAYGETAIGRIMNDTKMGRTEAEAVWSKLSAQLVQPGYLESARKIGGLGEGGVLLHEKFSALQMEAMTTARVDALREGMNVGSTFNSSALIGFKGLEPVTSNAPINTVTGISTAGSQYDVAIRQRYNVETGAKIDLEGIKGLAIVPKQNEFARIKELLNMYGNGVAIPDSVDAITTLHYMQAKQSDVLKTMVAQAEEVSRQVVSNMGNRAEGWANTEALDRVNKFMSALAGENINNVGGRLVEDSALVGQLGLADRAARKERIGGLVENFMSDMTGYAQRRSPGTHGSLFSAFARSGEASLLDYMQKNAMVTSAAFWDSTRRNVPTLTSATYDLFSEMYRAGHVGGMADIMSRLEFQGDPRMTARFAESFMGQDFTKPLGNVIPITEAAPGGVNLSTMEGRTGSIFDPTRADVQGNFSVRLNEPIYARVAGRDLEVTHVPVLGKMAYGGGVNVFEKPGEGLAFGATELEKKLANVVRHAHNPTMQATAVSEYFEEMHATLLGKKGYYRAKGVDVMGGVSGFLQTRSQANPFEMVIPEQMAYRVRDEAIRKSLLAGEDIYATVARHPIQAAPYMRIKVAADAGLGPNMLGMDERIRGLFGADDDKDILNLFFYRKGSQGAREAQAAINTLDSGQWRSLKTLEMLYGSVEDSRNIASAGVKSLPELLAKELQAGGTAEGRLEQVTRRMAGSTVGAYSNLLTQLYTNLEMHPTLGSNAEARNVLGHLFWITRQVPISAQKGKMKLDPENPLALYQQMRAGLNARNEEGVQQFAGAMEKAILGFKKETVLDAETSKLYTEMTGKVSAAGDQVNALLDVLQSEKGMGYVREFITKRNIQADQAAAMITRNVGEMEGESLYALHAMWRDSGNAFPYLRGMVGETRSGKQVARTLGAINETIKEGVREAKGPLGVLALGLGVGAAAAVATSRIKPMAPAGAAFSRDTGNFRPEQATTVSDQVPGEPMAGAMSSVNPPRRQLPPRRGAHTTVVAPMRQRTDLEVRMRAQDRGDTAEMQRMISQVGSGPGVQNVNVNYRNGWRNKMSRLRQRETIREELDR